MSDIERLTDRALELYAAGDDAGAERDLLEAIAWLEVAHGPDHPQVGLCLNHLGMVLVRAGRLDEAEAHCRRALEVLRRRPEPPVTCLGNLASTMIKGQSMDIEQILAELRYTRDDRRFPREALEHAVAAHQEITPHLLSVLEDARNRYRELAEDSGYMAHLYATYLLAQFREQRAYPLIVNLFSLPIDTLDRLAGDIITEDLGRILASVCGTDTTLIAGMIENEDLDEFVRGSAISALLSLVAAEILPREEVIGYFTELFRGKLARHASQVWNDLVSACASLSAVELARDVELAYRHGLVWPGYISLENVEGDFALGPEGVVERLRRNPDRLPITDAIRAMEWWAAFKKPKKVPVRAGRAAAKLKSPTKKIGRNQPCPCGSGKKYKKCCGSPLNR